MRLKFLIPALLAILVAAGCGGTVKARGDADEDAQPDTAEDVTGDTPVDSASDAAPDGAEDPATDAPRPDAEPDVEPDATGGGLVGDPCVDETELTDCGGIPSSERFCLNEMRMGPGGALEFPGGYCSAPCEDESDCGTGGLCIRIGYEDSYCFRECTSTGDCREGYVCDHFWSPSPPPSDYCIPPMW